jgi:Lon protease-like protein
MIFTMASGERLLHLPLFPLPNVVHFPRTELRLHVFEPRYRQMLRDLERAPGRKWIGMVLMRPGHEHDESDRPPIHLTGTAGRLESVEPLPDGRSNIVLHGDFRFEVEQEVGARPYRVARVRRLVEPDAAFSEIDLPATRRDLQGVTARLAGEMGERFPLATDSLGEWLAGSSTEELVNRLAAELDVPLLRKQQLLAADLPERARSLLSILRSRQRVLDLLRPFRHLASGAEHN